MDTENENWSKVVYLCGYSCGIRAKNKTTSLIKWDHTETTLDLCWTCACYITDDSKIVYLGFCNDVSPSIITTTVESPTEPVSDKLDYLESNSSSLNNKSSDNSIKFEKVTCNVGDKSATIPDHSCSWCLIADEGFEQVVCGWKLLAAITLNGRCILWRDVKFGNPLLSSGEHSDVLVKHVSLGEKYSIVLSNEGKAFEIILEDENYILRDLPLDKIITQVSCGKEHVLLLTQEGCVYSYGLGTRGQLGHGELGEETVPRKLEALEGVNIEAVAAGGWHSAALDSIGSVYMWGWNESGQLALPCGKLPNERSSTITIQSIPTLVNFPLEFTVKTISLGSRHSAALADDGRLWTWGWNGYGQLCLGDKNVRDKPTVVEIDNANGKVVDVRCRDWSTIVWVHE